MQELLQRFHFLPNAFIIAETFSKPKTVSVLALALYKFSKVDSLRFVAFYFMAPIKYINCFVKLLDVLLLFSAL